MGTVFKRTSTKPLPVGAELYSRKGQRIARWTTPKGKTRTAAVVVPTEGQFIEQERIAVETPTYTAKFRDGAGHVRTVATGCKDETAARAVLAELEKRAEKVRSGIITNAENAMTVHQHTPLNEHVGEFIATMRAAGRAECHVTGTERLIQRVINEAGFRRLSDIRAEAVERWLGQQATAQPDKPTMGARTRNSYLVALRTFCNWCVERDRLPFNPLAKLDRADERSDRRRQRRALTEAELCRLLIVARLRPLAEYGRETMTREPSSNAERGKRKRGASWTYKALTFDELNAAVGRAHERLKDSPEFIAQQERLGQERELIYKLAVTTGLRKNEIASLTVGQLDLDGDCPQVTLYAADEKNRQGNSIPLRQAVADELREWVSNSGAGTRHNTLSIFNRGESDTSAASKLFNVPDDLSKVFERDRTVAGIAKSDDRGRTVDVHALRHTFGTMLSKAGVSPRVAQAAMRHSSLELTMNVYTDPRLLDVQGAVESLPEFSVTNEPNENRQRIAAGAETLLPSAVTPTVLPAADFSSVSQSTAVTYPAFSPELSVSPEMRKTPQKSTISRSFAEYARRESNPQPSDPKSDALSN